MADAQKLRIPLGIQCSSVPSFTTLGLNDTSKKVAGVFQVPGGAATRTLTRAGCMVGNAILGTSPAYRISLQSLSSNVPSGTVLGGGTPASKVFTPTTANKALLHTLDNAYVANAGDWIAVVVDYSSGTVDGSNHARFNYETSVAHDWGHMPYGYDYQTSWTRRGLGPFALGTSTELWGNLVDAYGDATYSSSSSPNERGCAFTMPDWLDEAELEYFEWHPASVPSSTAQWVITIYEGRGAADKTVLHTETIDSTHVFGNRRNWTYFTGSSLPVLVGGQDYRIAIKSADTLSINQRRAICTDTDLLPLHALTGNATWTTRTSTGDWTDVNTEIPLYALGLKTVTPATGGGGGGGSFYIAGA
jgi:hypothetical protein